MKVILTGAPGTGKSSVFYQLRRNGFDTVPEVARFVFNFLEAQKLTHYTERNFIQQYIEVNHILNWTRYDDEDNVFFDRSLPDEVAYRKFYKMKVPKTLVNDCLRYKADKVFIFPYWEEIYQNDDVRLETPEEAQELDELITSAYVDLGYEIIVVPKASVEDRVAFITKQLEL